MLARQGWDAEGQGLGGAPELRLIVGEQVHASVLKAFSLLSLGRDRAIRVPVDEIIHPFIHKRIEQTRGVPACVAAMLRLQMIGGMDEAALVAARAGAQKMGVITKDVPDNFEADDDYYNGGVGRTIDGAPGEFIEMPMGFDIKPLDWKSPEDYAPFQKTQLRGAAAGYGVSYSAFANDPSDANFSATKIGMMEEREGYRGGQQFFINHILREAFPDFLEAAMLAGIADLPFSRFEDYIDDDAVVFSGRSFPWLDPQKDIAAAREAIELGVDTRSRIARENACDFEEITAELGREERLRKAAGLGAPEVEGQGISKEGKGKKPEKPAEASAVKSAFIGEVAFRDLPPGAKETVAQFAECDATSKVIRYGMTVPELLAKADQHNLETARKHCRRLTIAEAGDIVRGRADKFILVHNDRIIDGHHHLAKAEKGKVTSSLPVLDLTPLRFQAKNG